MVSAVHMPARSSPQCQNHRVLLWEKGFRTLLRGGRVRPRRGLQRGVPFGFQATCEESASLVAGLIDLAAPLRERGVVASSTCWAPAGQACSADGCNAGQECKQTYRRQPPPEGVIRQGLRSLCLATALRRAEIPDGSGTLHRPPRSPLRRTILGREAVPGSRSFEHAGVART